MLDIKALEVIFWVFGNKRNAFINSFECNIRLSHVKLPFL